MKRRRALPYCLRMIFFGKPVPAFPDRALAPVAKAGFFLICAVCGAGAGRFAQQKAPDDAGA
jgi:hypothetical protein